jgi:PAS domain S-box-containing protein
VTDVANKITKDQTASEKLRISEIRYRRLFESARDGILILDAASGKITDVNPFMLEFLGYSRDEFLGKELWEIGLFKDKDESRIAFQELQATGYIRYEDLPLQTKAGNLWNVEFISNVYEEDGNQVIQCNIRDITERKSIQERQKQSEQWLRTIFEASHEGILVEENERIHYVNKSYLHMFGYDDLEELIGQHISVVIAPEDAARLLEFGRSRVRGEQPPSEYEFKGRRKDGSTVDVEASVSASNVGDSNYITTMIRDITERKAAEEAIRFQAHLLDTVEQSVIATDLDGNVIYWNQFAQKLYGWTAQEAIGRQVMELTTPKVMTEQALEIMSRLRQGESWAGEFNVQRRDGTTFPVQIINSPINDDKGKLIGIIGVSTDITERKRAEQALRESENKYRLLVEQASDGIHTYDMQGNFIETNSKLCEMLGYASEELLRLNVRDLVPAEDLAADPIRFDELRAGKTLLKERRLRRKDGTLLPVEISGRMIRDNVLQAIIRDITERKRAEQALMNLNEQLERRVADRTVELMELNASLQAEIAERRRAERARALILRRLVFAQEDERRRIAREMHDQFGQQLTVLKLKLDALKGDCTENEELCEQVEELQTIAGQLDADVDHIVWEMRPTALDDLGLQSALSSYVQNWSKHVGLPIQLHVSGMDGERLTPEVETAFYRIAQEALNNIAKHAEAKSVAVMLERRADQVSLIIEDDGVGFEIEQTFKAHDKGLGLVGMRERAALVGGTVEVESQPNSGTTLVVRIPTPYAVVTEVTDE